MYLLIIFLPLFSFILSSFFGFFIGQYGSAVVSTLLILGSCLLSFFSFIENVYFQSSCNVSLFSWINIGVLKVTWSFFFDSLTCTMLCIILLVSLLVHLYSIEYMKGDPHLSRFISYLSLFTFFMLILVTSSNFLQLFLGWEGVGLCSYLLISFWFTRLQANKSAIKAVIVNKIGDFGLILAISAFFFLTNSLDFPVCFSIIQHYVSSSFFFNFGLYFFEINYITFITCMLFLGAMGKSAQLFLHTWLPDAMEGPTPVSALIHAATMVTAGVFLIVRCSCVFELSSFTLSIITIIGALTAFFAATSGLLQYDLKKVIAYSTCSQLGYMVFCCGLSSYDVSLFHLANHAFFKALLFLSAGAVIHALNNEQDMRRMGGLIKVLPFTYTMFLIGSLALAGFPFLTGFYSKDVIIEISSVSLNFSGMFVYWLGVVSAFLTSFYSFRLIHFTFFAITNSKKNLIENAHDAPLLMAIPLIILAVGSIFFGYLFKDLLIGLGNNTLSSSIYIDFYNLKRIDAEFMPFYVKIIPFIFSSLGIFFSLFLYKYFPNILYSMKYNSNIGKYFFVFFNKKWFFDPIYNYFFVMKFLNFGYKFVYRTLDQGIIELLGPKGLTIISKNFSFFVNRMNTGYIFDYAFYFIFGILFLLVFLSNSLFFSFFYIYVKYFFLFLFCIIFFKFF